MLQAALKGPSETHGIVEGGRMLELDVGLQRVAKVANEEIDLILFLESALTGEQGQELRLVLLHCPSAVKLHEGAERIAACRGIECPLHLVDELQPCEGVVVLLQAVIPVLGITFHVERGEPDALVLGGAVGAEELLRLVELKDRVRATVIAWETPHSYLKPNKLLIQLTN